MQEYWLHTKTPIWTGGIRGISDRIYETGVIGSMRWWYEVVLRGLGVFACDPTEEDTGIFSRCPVGPKNAKKYCNACDLFGTTGHQRQFKINITPGSHVYDQAIERERINIKCTNPQRHSGWFLGAGRIAADTDPIVLQMTPFAYPTETDNTLNVLLALLSRWAGIGARQQHGYGVFDVSNTTNQSVTIEENDLNVFLEEAKSRDRDDFRDGEPNTDLPTFKNFFFAKIRLNNLPANWQNHLDGVPTIPEQRNRFDTWHTWHNSRIFSPSLKNQLRFVVFNGNYANQEHLFGKSSVHTKAAAKVNVSHIYKENDNTEVRIWGDVSNDTIKQQIYDALNGATYAQKPPPASPQTVWQAATGQSGVAAQVTEWREMNGHIRCMKTGVACATPCHTMESFLRCLLL